MTARRKKRPKKSCFSISSKRRCDAVKRGWCSIVKSAVGEASDRIWAVVVYQSVLRRSDRGVCFFVLLSQYHCLEEAESKVYPSISLFYTVPHLWLFYIKWLQYGKPLTKIQGLTFDPENLGPRVHDSIIWDADGCIGAGSKEVKPISQNTYLVNQDFSLKIFSYLFKPPINIGGQLCTSL